MTTDETIEAVRVSLFPSGWEFAETSTEDGETDAGYCENCGSGPDCVVCGRS